MPQAYRTDVNWGMSITKWLIACVLAVAACEEKSARPPPTVETSRLVDINTATERELEALPGIGQVYAKKIVEGRPYQRKDQLRSRNIVPEWAYEKCKDLVIAKQPK